ncbi:DUF3078 domain-containing protein [Pedobacter sp. HMF7647]|uniref:DUF3078 domain-containing protein n=1 Tax=Hufsiella arboris TaxID=2695275 RepID=A0A7K1Y612_9SPHI|nr:DUF3078 domain-containing protein [Hufsiella arboris]MXV49851.1 DUF3078 domain-containing protein [Hufsiella arboris]
MAKKCTYLLLLIFCTITVSAQVDTSKIKDLKLYPRKNLLRVRKPVIQLEPVTIPVSDLELKINYWKTWITLGANLNQATFSDNWSGGGVNSVAVGTSFNYKTDYTKGDKNFTSELILLYGKLKNKDQLQKKTNDRIFWDNKVALKLSKSWYFFGSLSFESQFDDGFNYTRDSQGNEVASRISKFMAPGYLTESVGFEFKPVKYFNLRIGTGTARQTFVLDTTLYHNNEGKNYGVPIGNTFKNELAFQLVANLDKDIFENVNLKSRYMMFIPYKDPLKIDHRLDVTLTAKVNRFMNVTLTGIGLYDDDASTRIQASEALALGLVYKIPK